MSDEQNRQGDRWPKSPGAPQKAASNEERGLGNVGQYVPAAPLPEPKLPAPQTTAERVVISPETLAHGLPSGVPNRPTSVGGLSAGPTPSPVERAQREAETDLVNLHALRQASEARRRGATLPSPTPSPWGQGAAAIAPPPAFLPSSLAPTSDAARPSSPAEAPQRQPPTWVFAVLVALIGLTGAVVVVLSLTGTGAGGKPKAPASAASAASSAVQPAKAPAIPVPAPPASVEVPREVTSAPSAEPAVPSVASARPVPSVRFPKTRPVLPPSATAVPMPLFEREKESTP